MTHPLTGPGADDAPPHDAVVLAGGAATRLGGVSKPDVVVAGRRLLDRVLDAAAGAREVVVVGPPELGRPGLRTVLEHPPSGGPVAGIEAGLSALPTADDGALCLVLACDVPSAGRAVPALVGALAERPDADGAQVVDGDGHPQLVALLRRRALRARLDRLLEEGGVHGVAVRRMLDGLVMVDVPDDDAAQDADTWSDVERLDAALTPDHDTTTTRPPPDHHGGDPVSDNATAPTPSDLHRWVVRVTEELDVDPDALDVDGLLDLARDVAHTVARPAVPLTTFLAGYAVARRGGDRTALEGVVAEVARLVGRWPDLDGATAPTGGAA